MQSYLLDWLNLLGRWLHLIAGVAWIGASFYFVWLDNSLRPLLRPEASDPGVGGEVWSVHGGGFYHAQKYRVAPPSLPPTLHWFYWEAYTTWLSGFFLLCLLYYARAEVYLIDPSVAPLSKPVAIALGLGFLAASWLIYDALCRSPLGRHERSLAAVMLVLLSAESWALCHLFSGRGAFIEFGSALGTIMVANVLFVIIPGQRELVRAKREGREPEARFGIAGKQRSVHNTYFTLPVLFTMISNHFAMTYGARDNWLVLIAISFGGACLRAWWVERQKAQEPGQHAARWPLWAGSLALLVLVYAQRPASSSALAAAQSPAHEFAQVQAIVGRRCVSCHAQMPTQPGFTAPPSGVVLDSAPQIIAHAEQMQVQLASHAMPVGNLTNMSEQERALMLAWVAHGAQH